MGGACYGPEHNPLLFHQSGGCCDGELAESTWFPQGSFGVGERLLLLGELEGTPFYWAATSSRSGSTLSS